jgi:hypothetical protein
VSHIREVQGSDLHRSLVNLTAGLRIFLQSLRPGWYVLLGVPTLSAIPFPRRYLLVTLPFEITYPEFPTVL